MNFGVNLQYLRMMNRNMTQEELANKLGVSRQTVSKWELSQGNPELAKIKEICSLFNCKSDDLLFGVMRICDEAYSDIEIELIEAFKYFKYTVISTEPEDDALAKIRNLASQLGVEEHKIIGWDFPYLSQEQVNIHHMHGYTAALVFPIDQEVGLDCSERQVQNYVTLVIKNPMSNPFHLISNAFKSVFQYIKVNRYTYDRFAFEHVYWENGIEYMKICVSIKERIVR